MYNADSPFLLNFPGLMAFLVYMRYARRIPINASAMDTYVHTFEKIASAISSPVSISMLGNPMAVSAFSTREPSPANTRSPENSANTARITRGDTMIFDSW